MSICSPRHLKMAAMALTPGGTLPEDASVDSRGRLAINSSPALFPKSGDSGSWSCATHIITIWYDTWIYCRIVYESIAYYIHVFYINIYISYRYSYTVRPSTAMVLKLEQPQKHQSHRVMATLQSLRAARFFLEAAVRHSWLPSLQPAPQRIVEMKVTIPSQREISHYATQGPRDPWIDSRLWGNQKVWLYGRAGTTVPTLEALFFWCQTNELCHRWRNGHDWYWTRSCHSQFSSQWQM